MPRPYSLKAHVTDPLPFWCVMGPWDHPCSHPVGAILVNLIVLGFIGWGTHSRSRARRAMTQRCCCAYRAVEFVHPKRHERAAVAGAVEGSKPWVFEFWREDYAQRFAAMNGGLFIPRT